MIEILHWIWFVISMFIAVGYVAFLILALLIDIRQGGWNFWSIAGGIYVCDYVGDFWISQAIWGDDATTGVLAAVALVLGYGIWFFRD